MKFSSTKIVMRDGSVSPAKTIKKADAGRYEPDRVLFDSIRRSPTIDAKERVMLDMHRIRKEKGFKPIMFQTVNIDDPFVAVRSLCDEIHAAVTLGSLLYLTNIALYLPHMSLVTRTSTSNLLGISLRSSSVW